MKIHNRYESLAALGFIPKQIERLQQLRAIYEGKKQKERRRLEFVRWLVATGRLTEGYPTTSLFEEMQKGNSPCISGTSTSA